MHSASIPQTLGLLTYFPALPCPTSALLPGPARCVPALIIVVHQRPLGHHARNSLGLDATASTTGAWLRSRTRQRSRFYGSGGARGVNVGSRRAAAVDIEHARRCLRGKLRGGRAQGQ